VRVVVVVEEAVAVEVMWVVVETVSVEAAFTGTVVSVVVRTFVEIWWEG
jgi:predicted nuclease with TOPRIM domain